MAEDSEPEEVQALCSGCFEGTPVEDTHVIPYFNDFLNGFVTTYRCPKCWLPALAETRERLAGLANKAEVASAAAFFERHSVSVPEFERGDSTNAVRKRVLELIDKLRSEELRLTIGEAIPVKDIDDLKDLLNLKPGPS